MHYLGSSPPKGYGPTMCHGRTQLAATAAHGTISACGGVDRRSMESLAVQSRTFPLYPGMHVRYLGERTNPKLGSPTPSNSIPLRSRWTINPFESSSLSLRFVLELSAALDEGNGSAPRPMDFGAVGFVCTVQQVHASTFKAVEYPYQGSACLMSRQFSDHVSQGHLLTNVGRVVPNAVGLGLRIVYVFSFERLEARSLWQCLVCP